MKRERDQRQTKGGTLLQSITARFRGAMCGMYPAGGFWNMFTSLGEKNVSAPICRGNCGVAALFEHILYGRGTIRHTSGHAGQITYCTTLDIWS